MDIGYRIRKRRKELNLSQEELAKKVGYESRSAISKLEKEANGMTQSKLLLLAKALECSPSYLMGWEDEEADVFGIPGVMPIKTKKFPLLGNVACGEPIFAEQHFESFVEAGVNLDADFCLKAQGDSMINARIFDGDVVFVRKQPDVENREIGVVLIGDEATIKRVYKYTDRIILQPENPTHQPLIYEGEKLNEIRILGKVVAFMSIAR